MGITLKDIGLTQDEIVDRVIEKTVESVMRQHDVDEDGEPCTGRSAFARSLEKMIVDKVDEKVRELAEKHVLPFVTERIDNLTLQETNKWGERAGTEMTFVEYLVARAEAYMTCEVDFEGKEHSNNYSWQAKGTRLAHMINKHLHYQIEHAMKDALQAANNTLAKGIEGTVKIQLERIIKGIKANVEMPR